MNVTITFTDDKVMNARTISFDSAPAVATTRELGNDTLIPLLEAGTITSATFVKNTGKDDLVYSAHTNMAHMEPAERNRHFYQCIADFTGVLY